MSRKHTVSLIPGDGIGPEVTTATRKIIDATGVKIDWEICEAGAEVFKKGLGTGVPKETVDSIIKNKVALKGPLETPIGFGEKSANVTLRKMFDTYGNIRPITEFPGVQTPYSGRGIDIVIVRENVEDLYAGIEHMQSPGVAQCLKLISRKGCEKIVRLAFEFAKSEGRKLVHCATKANIMKETEGLMKRTFEDIAKEYPDIESHHIIVDNCAHQLVKKPEQFNVIVTTNMNGDILSDLGSALIGGLGFAPGANIGDKFSIFEAVHGSAPKYAGKNSINPTAVLLSGVMMLRHLGEFEAAKMIENALLTTLAVDKILTRDILGDKGAASTTEFTDAIIRNLDKTYPGYKDRDYHPIKLPHVRNDQDFVRVHKRVVNGIDLFIETGKPVIQFAKELEAAAANSQMKLKMISNRGVKVYPSEGNTASDLTDCFSCRFVSKESHQDVKDAEIIQLLEKVEPHFRWSHIEKLNEFDGVAGYTKSHGED
ncbi:NADP-dependent isocitrate dehydrogenase [Candidatus Paracaedibacter symbiosus]|uniref:NADP-dependent isocitrate dehydrogenase n=1 Tax=Candidatus Paracaedibacter symbiosus TaxID=244582 RepID=UPI000509A1F5|nr:NADP-dependent isocitrate dehydrogenase [Candidatus Paracaedibacter symbiosus]